MDYLWSVCGKNRSDRVRNESVRAVSNVNCMNYDLKLTHVEKFSIFSAVCEEKESKVRNYCSKFDRIQHFI